MAMLFKLDSGFRGTPISPNGRLQSLRIFQRFPNFKMREAPISRILDFYVKKAHPYKKIKFENSFLDEKVVKIHVHNSRGCFFYLFQR